jgi:hypothetical protein
VANLPLKHTLLVLFLAVCAQPWLAVDLARAEPALEQRSAAQPGADNSSINGAEARAARLEARRRRHLAGRTSPRLGVTLGYDGALLVHHGSEEGRFRSPSVLLGLLFRRHYHRWLGLHVLLAPALGPGRFGAGHFETEGTQSMRVGPSFTGIGEVGMLVGPGDWVYFMLAAQSRLVVQPEHEVRFVFESGDEPDVLTVRWSSPMLCVGARAGVGLMLGRRHEYFVELGGGGGAVLAQDAAYITVGLRAGYAFEL